MFMTVVTFLFSIFVIFLILAPFIVFPIAVVLFIKMMLSKDGLNQ